MIHIIFFSFFSALALNAVPVNWDIIFPDIPVEYDTGISPDKDYWSSIEKGTLVVIVSRISNKFLTSIDFSYHHEFVIG